MRRISRSQAIAELREHLLGLVDDEHSLCYVAARDHVFCGGFARWSFTELRRRYPQIVRSRPRITPRELRELADRWQLARQMVTGTRLACDAQMLEKGQRACQGWDELSDAELAGFHRSLCGGEEVEIVPETAAAGPVTPRGP